MTHRVKWLIVFLVQNVHETKQDTKFLDQTLQQLLELPANEDIGIAGCISTTVISKRLRNELNMPVEGAGPVHSLLIRPMLGRRRQSGGRLELWGQWSTDNYDLQNADFVTYVLKLIKRQYKYEHVILTTWDHGSGYAIFTVPDELGVDIPNTKRTKAASQAIRNGAAIVRHPDHHTPMHRMFQRGPLLEQTKGVRGRKNLAEFRHLLEDLRWLYPPSGLTIDRLRQSILDSFGKVDVIFMRNCFMQMFDTGFALRDVANYLVACESVMFFQAYSYIIWLRAMRTGKHLTAESAAVKAVKGFTQADMWRYFRNHTSIFANDLSYYMAISSAMDKMVTELIWFVAADYERNKNRLIKRRNEFSDFAKADFPDADFQLIDGAVWFEAAAEFMADNNNYKEALIDFQDLHKRMVKASYVGHRLPELGFFETGFSLYFPTSLKDVQQFMEFYELYYAMHSPYRALYTRYSLWDEFISYIFLEFEPHLLQKKTNPL